MPRSLGGNLTLRSVCSDCNTGLSHLDQSLVDSSLLILPRMARQPGAFWGQSAHLGMGEGYNELLEVSVGHRFQSVTKAQLIFRCAKTPNAYSIFGGSENLELYERFFRVLRKQITKGGLRSIRILKPVEPLEGSEAGFRLVLNRNNEVVFRPSSAKADCDSEFAAMVDLLEKKAASIEAAVLEAARKAPVLRRKQPELTLGITADFGRNLRAVAKIAYTFLASCYGPDFVTGENLAPLREYIRTGTGADEQGSMWWNGDKDERSLGSSRFAIWLKDHNGQVISFGRPDVHVITVMSFSRRHVVIIEFFGEISFAVDVGDLGLGSLHPVVHEFDYLNRSNRSVEIGEVIERFREKVNASKSRASGSF